MNETPENIDNQQEKKSNGAFIAIILLLLLALGAMAYLWSAKNSQLNECNNANLALQTDIDGMNKMMSGYVDNMSNDLRKDFQNMLSTYDALMEKDSRQADSLMAQKEQIQAMLDDMDQLKRTNRLSASKLVAMQKENETMRRIMKGYVVQIDSLNTLNLQLSTDLQTTKSTLNETTSERDQYKSEAERNAAMVKKGQRLQAYNFSSTGLRNKLNNTTEPTNRARNTIQIRSSFTLSENPLTPVGAKTVYMQVIDPSGKTLQTRSSNVVETDNGPIAYSDSKDIDYQNKRLDLSIYYDFKGQDAAKGNYKVRIYVDGAMIGSDSFTLK